MTPKSEPISIKGARSRFPLDLHLDLSPEVRGGQLPDGWRQRVADRMQREKTACKRPDGVTTYPPARRVVGFQEKDDVKMQANRIEGLPYVSDGASVSLLFAALHGGIPCGNMRLLPQTYVCRPMHREACPFKDVKTVAF